MEWIISAFLVNILIGATGIGGGSMMTPILMLLGVPSGAAGGSALLQAGISKTLGGSVYCNYSLVDWRVVSFLWMGSLPTAGIWLYLKLAYPALDQWLKLNFNLLIAAMLLLCVVGMWMKMGWIKWSGTKDRSEFWLVLGAAFLGTAVSLTSVGAGVLGTVLLLLLRPSLDPKKMVGTEIVHAVPLAFLASIGFLLSSAVDWWMVGLLLLGALPGMWVGSRYAIKANNKIHSIGMSGILIGLAVFHGMKG